MSVAARRVLLTVFLLALSVGGSALGDASASAEVIHDFEFSFNGSQTPAKSFEGELGTVALDQASGDVYVVDSPAGFVYEFDSVGKYVGEIAGGAVPQGSLGLSFSYSGVAVDNSAGANKGDLYVAGTENGVVYRFDSTGKLLSELNGSVTLAGSFSPRGVAVGASGDLYVADGSNDVVDEFDASGKLVSELRSPEIVNPETIAVDSSGNVFLSNFEPADNVVKLEPGGGASVLGAKGGGLPSVAFDPATNDAYVGEDNYPSPGLVAQYDSSGSRLGAFGEGHFPGAVKGIAVHDTTGEVYASDGFEDLIAVFGPAIVIPDATTEPASSVQPVSATLNGTVDPDALPVTACRFEYGTSAAYGQSASCIQSTSIGSGTTSVAVSANLNSLSADTEYHFRLVASNANGANDGADVTFTTSGPPRIDSESTTSINRTSAILQGQVNPFGFDTTYRFEYGTSSTYGTSVPVPNADIGSGIGDVAVSQAISGLVSGVTYHYRIIVTSLQGTIGGPDQTFTSVPPAYIDGEYVTDVASTSATIDANVNPNGSNTTYSLEYGTTSSYGHVLAGNLGEGSSDVLVSYHLQELLASATYHYRIVVHNEFGTGEGADHTFTTQAAGETGLELLDGRTWELVSPPNKQGALIGPFSAGQIQAAADGSGISYVTDQPVGEDPLGKSGRSQILSVRSLEGWRSQDISIPYALPSKEAEGAIDLFDYRPEYRLFSPDLAQAIIEPHNLVEFSLSHEAPERTDYLRNNATGSYVPLVNDGNVPPGTKYGGEGKGNGSSFMKLAGASDDLSHVVLTSPEALTPEAQQGTCEGECNPPNNIFEWSAGRLQLVNVLPNGETSPGAELAPETERASHAISRDGRWIVWKDAGLYVRDMVDRTTMLVGPSSVQFETMSADGSRIFFLEDGDLYEFDTATGTRTDLTSDYGVGESSAGVQDALLGASEDGSYVYFVATGVLASGADAGANNLYMLHESGDGWMTTYIATLSGDDTKDWFGQLSWVSSRVSPDGRYATFMSDRSLTGYDNVDAYSGQPDEEVYIYDAASGGLVCASCNPTGARPVGVLDQGNSLLVDRTQAWSTSGSGSDHWLGGSVPGWVTTGETTLYQPRYLADSGRLFFNSPDALVPQDTNGLEDVYEYEPLGVGSCMTTDAAFSAGSHGCVDLVSSGTSSGESVFMDASETGNDVFFATASRLTTEDFDTSYDMYVAHVCLASAPCAVSPVSSPPCTSGDSCKAAPSPQPVIFGAAPSATFSGTGNVVSSSSASGGVVRPKALTRAQKLARALTACRKKKRKAKRAVCERQARKHYSAKRSRIAKAKTKGQG